MRELLAFLLFLSAAQALADCAQLEGLDGALTVPSCDSENCVPGAEAVNEYSARIPENDDPTVLVLSLHTSPWRFYDSKLRILPVEDLAEMARPYLAKGVRRILVMGSWSGVAPSPGGRSLAERLSAALGRFPVSGTDGFLWLAKDGTSRTTRQAVSIRSGRGPYLIQPGAEVMVSMAAGWPASVEDVFRQGGDAFGVLHAGAGWDILHLCPEKALASYEAAARLSDPLAAYNAALMRLERGRKGDREAAIALLRQAASAGDQKARQRLASLKKERR